MVCTYKFFIIYCEDDFQSGYLGKFMINLLCLKCVAQSDLWRQDI